jgi:hypothetical protein
VLNRYSYNLRLFLPKDEKRATAKKPWGYSLFGHHLCIAVAFAGRTMVIGPTFMGAEPDRIDVGPHKGLRLFTEEERRGLNLMRSLSPENHKRALLCEGMNPKEGLGEDRWNPFDERHLGGARQDNRIVPYGELKELKLVSELVRLTGLLFLIGKRAAPFPPLLKSNVKKSITSLSASISTCQMNHFDIGWSLCVPLKSRRTFPGSVKMGWVIHTTIAFIRPLPFVK